MQNLTLDEAKSYQAPEGFVPPLFLRHEVAKILNCTVLTMRNREKTGKYPTAERNLNNNYRIYTFNDVCYLQYLTFGQIYLSPIVSVLYDKGYKDIAVLDQYLSANLVIFNDTLASHLKEASANA